MSSQQPPGWNDAGQAGPAGYGPASYQAQPPYQPYPNGPGVPGGYHHLQPLAMPGQVRAAQVLFFVMGGFGLLAMVLAIVRGDAEAAGSISVTSLPAFLGLICALRFPKRKPNSRGTAIFLASLMLFIGFGTMGRGQPVGLVLCAVGVTIVILLSQRQSGHWFRRPVRP
ncbi:hypothetical protein [Streptomyces sp. NEAU-YJ-81]|uniref:hypothetical protein n=1 Tax=Streptomyces sp. NEAU-YJ-81 TaxID=2820288 RepID=UPI001ABD391E|nr:hypothetical protein [Streptomyces sp. NEAU-YJ-81]MBO3680207.1 hypothetical protein [Streptomyces sp. NEAU-YJ-81]